MLHVVLDTNLLVSGLLSPHGNSANIINALRAGQLKSSYSPEIIQEYIDVLTRPKLNIPRGMAVALIEAIKKSGSLITPIRSTCPLPDETDRMFYDVAKTAHAYLVTGNIKHFPDGPFILLPADFIKQVLEKE